MECPVCKVELIQAGRTYKCEQCDGAWVQREVLVPMLEQRVSTLVELPWRDNQEDHVRPCPSCGTTMQTVALGSVALDRCEPHGVWFDARELPALLAESKQFRAPVTPHQGLLAQLAKLFA